MEIPQNPTFTESFHVEILSTDRIVVFNQLEKYYTLTGAIYPALASLLYPKPQPTKVIIDQLQEKFSEAEIYYALLTLQEKGLITQIEENIANPIRSFCRLLEVPVEEAMARLEEKELTVHQVGDVYIENLQEKLKKLSLKVRAKGNVSVIVTDHYRRREVEQLGKELFTQKKPFILIKPVGCEVWIGPICVAQKTGCIQCLLDRLEKNHIEERYIEQNPQKKAIPVATHFPILPTGEDVAYDIAANEIFKWVIGSSYQRLEGAILSYNLITGHVENHQLIKRPSCSLCGKKQEKSPLKPFVLQTQKVAFFSDGGYRIVSPEETLKKYQHHISPITGVIKALERSSHATPSMHAYFSIHASTEIGYQKESTFDKLRTFSAGKGKTEAQSKASCLCEALERYSGCFSQDEMRKKASYESLKQEAIHPYSCLLFSENQYKNRDTYNADSYIFQKVFAKFDERQEVEWSPSWSLTDRCWKWLPTSFCFYGYHPKDNIDRAFCVADSNGCASGNTKEEAILQGFFELVERDAIAIWWYNRLSVSAVDLTTLQDPYIHKLLKSYEDNNREIWVLDITMDIQIPTFAAVSRKKEGLNERIIFGFGSHFDPKIALFRALTETNQLFVNDFSPYKEQDVSNKDLIEWLKTARIEDHPYLLPSPKRPLVDLQWQHNKPYFQDIKEGVELCQRLVEEKGLEMLVQDQTRSDIGLSVVRVTVPGLRHFWRRFAPGRLYDVPVSLGYLDERLTEEELNPIPMFL